MRRRPRGTPIAGYDAFISYSHGADLDLAPVVRDGLQRLAKPWNRRRALSIFLDQASLEVSSELGSSLDKRIEDTRWLIVFMSEEAAQSKWVGEEIAEWAATKSKDQMALVLTSGEVFWDDEVCDFDYARSTAVSGGLRGVYTGQESEPLYYDLRWAKEVPTGEKTLDLNDLRFRDAIATIAAPIHGMPKDELEGKDVREFKRARLLKRAAITGLAALTVIAVAAGIVALIQRNSAIQNELRATSTALASQSENRIGSEPDLAALLALESFRTKDTVDARGALLSVLGTPTSFLGRDAAHGAPVSAIAHHGPSGITATADLDGAVVLWTTSEDGSSERLGVEIQAGGEVSSLAFSDDGTQLSVALFEGDVEQWGISAGAAEQLETIATPTYATALSGDGSLAVGFTELDGQVGILVYDLFRNEPLQFGALGLSVEEFDDAEPTSFAFSDDSSMVAFADETEIVLLRWTETDEIDVIDLEELQIPNAASLALTITSVGFVADGSRLAFGIDEGNIFLVDVDPASRTPPIEANPPPTNDTHALASLPVTIESGEAVQLLASSHNNGEVKVWVLDEFSAFELYTLRGHDEEARAVAFTASGALASGSFDGDVIWWAADPSAQLGDPILPPEATVSHVFDVTGVEFIRDDLVASVDGDDFLKAWDPDARTPVDGLDAEGIVSIDAIAGLIASGWADGSVVLDDVDNGSRVDFDTDAVHGDAEVDVVAVSADRTMVVSADEDGTVALWDVGSGELVEIVDSPPDFDAAAIVFPSRELLWVGGAVDPDEGASESVALRIDTTSGAVLETARHNADEVGHHVTSIALSPDGSTLATGGSDRRIFLWDTADVSTERAELAAHVDTVRAIVFVDDNVLLAGDLDGRILMWDVAAGRPVGELFGPSDGVTSLALHPDATSLVAGSEDDTVWIWDLRIDNWLDGACDLAGRNLTSTEWSRFLLAGDPVRHCPQFGPEDRPLATYPTDDR